MQHAPKAAGARAVVMSPCRTSSEAAMDLGKGGERLDAVAQHLERQAGADRKGVQLPPLGGLRDAPDDDDAVIAAHDGSGLPACSATM